MPRFHRASIPLRGFVLWAGVTLGVVALALAGVWGASAHSARTDGPVRSADGRATAGSTAAATGATDAGNASQAPVSAPLPVVATTPPGLPAQQPEPGSGLLGTVAGPSTGVFAVAAGEIPAPGTGAVRTVRVEVEQGLPVDVQVFADAVLATLNDPRGWSALDGVTFARTASPDASIRVILATPDTTDAYCAPLRTGGIYSCGVTGMAVLNFNRWALGATDFGTDMTTYRKYVVNHEVGHVIGHSHTNCPAAGELAPVMVQQTISAQGCVVNGWPNPATP